MGFSPIGPSHTQMHGHKDVGHAERGAGSIHDTMKKAKAPHHTERGNLFCIDETDGIVRILGTPESF